MWIGRHNNLKLVLESVQAAVHKRKVTNLLLHSGQGFQYTHKDYHALLKHKKMKVSMSRKGNCLDNDSSKASLDISSRNIFTSTPS
ncbi:DDE-type integrase/transposase/recombinase [Paenibacillus lautus]|uniref:DDE-type integrase/transposase/recombinase n=1 Tax=Paenibacillus lautus TaxID=1401 RepID=UPI003D2A7608